MLIVDENDDPFEVARRQKQHARRVTKLEETVMNTLTTQRVDAHGPDILKVSWKEWNNMLGDPNVQSFAEYGQTLLFYTDVSGLPDLNRPRPRPIRHVLQNEVGVWNHPSKGMIIITLKDAGPDDHGEGKYHQVKEQIGG